MRPIRFYTFVFSIVLLLLVSSAWGQDPRGTMLGRITDATGAVMPGVEVRVTNAQTGVTITALSNDRGNYNMPFLLPAVYKVTAEMPGFKSYAREGVQIRVSETVEINIQMEVGEVSEVVNVTAETPVLDTAGASLGQVIDERRVLELPLFAGNPAELTMLAPGVMNATDMRIRKAAFNNAPSQMATDGNGQYNNEFQIDGVSNNFANGNGTSRIAFSPPPTAIKEFKIQTNPYDASVGHTIGAVTNVVTASGTNEIHGEAHFWERNSALDAPTFFQNKNKLKKAVYQDHRYGASAGGPVYIPHLYDGRSKTFWYYAYEGNKWGSPQSGYRTVPTEAMRGGDFSALLALGPSYQIYDPATTRPEGGKFRRDPLLNNIIPANRLDPVSQKLLAFYPLPNTEGDKEFRSNYFYNLSASEDYYVHLIRVDHVFSENHRLFARIHYDWWEEDKDHWFGDYSAIVLNRINRGFALDDVYVINPQMVLNVRYGITSQDFPEHRVTRGFDLASLGFSSTLVGLVDKELATIPRVQIDDFDDLGRWESGDGSDTSLTHSVNANMTRLQGNHNLKFGADIRVYRGNHNRFPSQSAPYFQFQSAPYTKGPLNTAAAASTGQDMAAFLLGIPGGSMERSASWALQEKYYGLYLHDDFKVNDKLTLNVGLRYELETPLTERFNRLVAGFAFGESNPIEAQAQANYALDPMQEIPVDQFRVQGGLTFVEVDGMGRSPYKGEKNNFQPKIGFAYQLLPKTILRGGYGIFHDTIGVNSNRGWQYGFSQSTPIQASLDSGVTYVASVTNPLPNGLRPVLGAAGGLLTNIGQSIQFYDYNLLQPYAQRWSFGIQQMLPWQFMIESTYVGNRGTRLGVTRNINTTPAQYLSTLPTRDAATISYLGTNFKNPFAGIDPIYGANMTRGNLLRPYPQFNNVNVEQPIGYSIYHSMQNRIERRFNQGFTFQLAHTWSKLMEAVEFLNQTDPTPYYVIGGFDRPHRIAGSGIWEIPVGRGRQFGQSLPSVVNGIIGGWQVSGIYQTQSGAPLGFGNAIFTGDLKDIPLPKDQRTTDRWFNVDAGFNKVSNQQLSNNIRTAPLRYSGVRGDDQVRWDFSFIKNFPIREDARVEFRAETYNAFNQVSFGNPNTTPTNASFGKVTGVVSPSGRSWQFALKVVF